MPERITSVLGSTYNPSNPIDATTEDRWGITTKINSVNKFAWELYNNQLIVAPSLTISYGILNQVNSTTKLVWSKFPDKFETVFTLRNLPTFAEYVDTYLGAVSITDPVDFSTLNPWFGIIPAKDTVFSDTFRQNYLFDEKPIPPADPRYIPQVDFNFTDEEINFTADFVKPLDFDKLKTRISPVNSVTEYPWARTKFADIYQQIKWGFGVNHFLVGGVVRTNYLIDEDAVIIPPEPPTNAEVITFVNIVNIVKLPERIPVQFDNLSLSYDIDSVAWSVSFDVADKATLNLIKPTQLNTVELEININGELFNVFIGKTNTTTGVDEGGTVRRKIKCSGWSVHKLLSHPYHPRRSHVETSQSTPAGILASELTGTGFTATWESVSWTIPANTFTYTDKAPLAALSELVQSVGAVVIPTPDAKSFKIKPRYPLSPWNWSGAGVDINLHENSLFTIDTEWLPQESPDSVYCYGEASTGVAVKAVRLGQPGTKTLPTVVSKYFTDTIPATERGRIEVAKNGFKEIVPVSTYVNPADGILQPLQLVQVTETDNVTTWRGQVVGVSLNLKRNGNALVQTIQLERHYEL